MIPGIGAIKRTLVSPRARKSSSSEIDWRVTLRRRIGVAAVLLGIWAVGIEAKLIYLQVFQQDFLAARARQQQEGSVPVPATRGDVLDRNGHVLATSADVKSVFVVPSEIKDKPAAIELLCRALKNCTPSTRSELLKRFNRQKAFAWVQRMVSTEQYQRVAALKLSYVGFRDESRRYYPNKQLAAHLLGWVGIENDGLAGIEFAYNNQIRGKDGTSLIHFDGRRNVFSRVEEPPTQGSTVELTIDEYIQHVVERELQVAIAHHRALSGSAIVMRPSTGEVLAMASAPSFDPNEFTDAKDFQRRNRAVQDSYEPGSTFKLMTASAAIEERLMPIDAMIDTTPGHLRIGNQVYSDTSNHGVLSFADVIADSSNVGAIKVGMKVGVDRLSRYVERYQFGRPVSRDFLGENPGRVWKADQWTELALASISIGYQVAVTPLQMLGAVSSIANRGEYVEPRVVRALYRDGRRYVVSRNVLSQTVNLETAATLTGIMEGVVEHGTGKNAQIPGFTVAGKTGTSAKLVDGRYSKTDYNASFVGFVPSRAPEIAIIVVIDSPRGQYYGGSVAAPVFQKIAESTLRYLGVAPTVNPGAPVLLAATGDGARIPAVATEPLPSISLVVDVPPGTIPDLRGMSARDANRTLVKLGLLADISGDGFVVSQTPPPGVPYEAGDRCKVILDRSPGIPRVSELRR